MFCRIILFCLRSFLWWSPIGIWWFFWTKFLLLFMHFCFNFSKAAGFLMLSIGLWNTNATLPSLFFPTSLFFIHVCVYICIYLYICVCIYTHVCMYICTHVHTCTCLCMCGYLYHKFRITKPSFICYYTLSLLTSGSVVLKLWLASESPGGLVRTHIAGPHSRDSNPVGLGRGLKTWTSNKFKVMQMMLVESWHSENHCLRGVTSKSIKMDDNFEHRESKKLKKIQNHVLLWKELCLNNKNSKTPKALRQKGCVVNLQSNPHNNHCWSFLNKYVFHCVSVNFCWIWILWRAKFHIFKNKMDLG